MVISLLAPSRLPLGSLGGAMACHCPTGARARRCAPLVVCAWRRSCQVPQALRQAYNLRQRAKRAARRQGQGAR